MRKQRLYLDTSVISHIDAPHKPKAESITLRFFEYVRKHENEYELAVSPVTLAEVRNCPEPKRTKLLDLLASLDIESLPYNLEAQRLADLYVESGVLGSKHIRDLTHIAYAVVARCDYIISWNFEHFVNTKTISRVNAVNRLNNYSDVFIVSPHPILGERPHEDD